MDRNLKKRDMDEKHEEEFKEHIRANIDKYMNELFKDVKVESKEAVTKRMLFAQLREPNLN